MHNICSLKNSWFILFQRSVDPSKQGGLQQIDARLMHPTPSLSYTHGHRKLMRFNKMEIV